MNRRNFIKIFSTVPVAIIIPKIKKKKEFRNDFKYHQKCIVNRKDYNIPSKERLTLYQRPTYYIIGLEIFNKYKKVNRFIIKANTEQMICRISIDVSNKDLFGLQKWFDWNLKPMGIPFQYENYNKVI